MIKKGPQDFRQITVCINLVGCPESCVLSVLCHAATLGTAISTLLETKNAPRHLDTCQNGLRLSGSLSNALLYV